MYSARNQSTACYSVFRQYLLPSKATPPPRGLPYWSRSVHEYGRSLAGYPRCERLRAQRTWLPPISYCLEPRTCRSGPGTTRPGLPKRRSPADDGARCLKESRRGTLSAFAGARLTGGRAGTGEHGGGRLRAAGWRVTYSMSRERTVTCHASSLSSSTLPEALQPSPNSV